MASRQSCRPFPRYTAEARVLISLIAQACGYREETVKDMVLAAKRKGDGTDFEIHAIGMTVEFDVKASLGRWDGSCRDGDQFAVRVARLFCRTPLNESGNPLENFRGLGV